MATIDKELSKVLIDANRQFFCGLAVLRKEKTKKNNVNRDKVKKTPFEN